MIITIDGPVASGKSTIARLLAQKLDGFYLNTGSLYRALAYALKQTDLEQLTEQQIAAEIEKMSYHVDRGVETVCYNQQDITDHLATPEVSDMASRMSTYMFVRQHANQMQRRLVASTDSVAVIDGRDSGSVVFADADIKCFITASDKVRAERWQQKMEQRNIHITLDQAYAQIQERDKRDKTRAVAPLIIPEDALLIENNSSDPRHVVHQILLETGLAQ